MKTVARMSEDERAQVRAWIRRWERVGPILERLRRQSIRAADTLKAIAAFDGAFETAVRDCPPKPYSGLVEQQQLFSKLRPLCEAKGVPEILNRLEQLRKGERRKSTRRER